MSTLGGLADRTKAEESRFFRAEDDLALRRRMERLVANASATNNTNNSSGFSTPAVRSSVSLSDFEREVLAARRTDATRNLSVRRTNPHKVDIDVARHAKRAPVHNTFVDYLRVPRVSMGRGRWDVEQGASVFSVADGKRLATLAVDEVEAAPKTLSARVALARQVVVESAKVDATTTASGLRVYPMLNPGRAFMWGTIFAVWGSAFAVLAASKAAGVATVEDLDDFVNRAAQAPVDNFKTFLNVKGQHHQHQQSTSTSTSSS